MQGQVALTVRDNETKRLARQVFHASDLFAQDEYKSRYKHEQHHLVTTWFSVIGDIASSISPGPQQKPRYCTA